MTPELQRQPKGTAEGGEPKPSASEIASSSQASICGTTKGSTLTAQRVRSRERLETGQVTFVVVVGWEQGEVATRTNTQRCQKKAVQRYVEGVRFSLSLSRFFSMGVAKPLLSCKKPNGMSTRLQRNAKGIKRTCDRTKTHTERRARKMERKRQGAFYTAHVQPVTSPTVTTQWTKPSQKPSTHC